MVEGPAYQKNFSALFCETAYGRQSRERKAKTIIAVLNDFFGTGFRSFAILRKIPREDTTTNSATEGTKSVTVHGLQLPVYG
jgi:hypothetical protein